MEVIPGRPEHRRLQSLTRRQRECMLLVKQGLSSKQIARELGISHRTVEQHVASALETLGVKTRMAAVALLVEIEREDEPPQDAQAFMLRTASDGAAAYVGQVAKGDAHQTDARIDAGTTSPHSILPPLGGTQNTATSAQRNAWILRIAILAIMLTGVLILSILGVSEMAGEVGS